MQQTRYNSQLVRAKPGLFWVMLLICPSSAVCQPLPDEATVSNLLRQLDSDLIATRNRSEAELVELGPQLLVWLDRHQDEIRWTSETRHRVARIREVLFQQQIDQARQASRVKLESGLTSAQISQALFEQTRNALVFHPPDDIEYPASSGEFWPWLAEFGNAHQWQLDETSFRELKLIPLDENRSASLAAAHRGPISLELLDDQRADGELANQLQFRLMWEPRIKPVGIRVQLAGLGTFDTRKEPWADFNRQAELNIPVSGNRFIVRFRVPLRQISSEPLNTVDLPVRLVMIAPPFTAHFNDIVSSDQFPVRRGGMTRVAVVRKEQQARRLTIQVESRYDPDRMAEPLQSHLVWSGYCSASLVHEGGQELLPAEVRDLTQGSYRFAMEFLFDLPSDVDDKWNLKFTLPAGLSLIDETIRLSIDP